MVDEAGASSTKQQQQQHYHSRARDHHELERVWKLRSSSSSRMRRRKEEKKVRCKEMGRVSCKAETTKAKAGGRNGKESATAGWGDRPVSFIHPSIHPFIHILSLLPSFLPSFFPAISPCVHNSVVAYLRARGQQQACWRFLLIK